MPREVYILQAGLVINAFGNGAANPFAVLYLHAVRGIPLALAGLAGSTSAVCAIVAGMVAGGIADRRGPRATMLAGLFISAIGWSLYPLVRQPWHAIVLAVLTGSGIGVWLTMQSTMLALITPAQLRHAAFAQQRVAANLGLGLGGLTGGLIVAAASPRSFSVLFGLNAATFVVYAAVLARLRLPAARPSRTGPRGYQGVLRDRVFGRLLVLNLAFVTVSVALVNSMLPVFAVTVAGIGEASVGLLFLLNSLLIVGAQMPVAKAIEGQRRTRGLLGMCVLFALTWLLVEAAGLVPAAALALLVIAVICLGFGECLYDSIYGPLVADLAPDGSTGRYLAASGLSWQVALVATPALAGAVLGAEPFVLWPVAAAIGLAAGAYTLRFESYLPAGVRRTPRPTAA